jgi:hypothetical protein
MFIFILKEFMSSKNMPIYKRLDHFNEIIDYVAATHARSATIPDESITGIKAKMAELAIKQEALTFDIMSDILRSMGLNKYLEDVPYLMQKLGGYAPPVFSQELRERLQVKFQEISFRDMNYNFILMKLLQILNETDLMEHVSLLNPANPKWATHDERWRDICAANDWPFYGMATSIHIKT